MKRILGIDVGSVTVGIAEIDQNGNLLASDYRFHEGHPRDVLSQALEDRTGADGFDGWNAVAVTRSAELFVDDPDGIADDHVAVMKAAGRLHGRIGSLLSVGGEKFGLFSWSEGGEYRSYKGNTSCAAGTGGFLDQQAERLGLASAAELAALAEAAEGEIPKIATRCAVFAKTDLTHAQQEGFALEAIADGLCRGLAGNLLDVLLDGEPPAQPLVICGGVSLNPAVVRHIGELTGTQPVVDAEAPLYGALGAAWNMLDAAVPAEEPRKVRWNAEDVAAAPSEVSKDGYRYPPLSLELSPYPDFSCLEAWEVPVDGRKGRYPVEVEVYEPIPAEGRGTLGIDIGSTSTKAVVIDDSGTVLLGLYTRTAGRPVEAMKAVLMALEQALENESSSFRVDECATTGSGRKLVGEILGADLILDEITAHARAAVSLDEDVDTIIEIGGQDAKFTTLAGGRVTGSVMNNVCAAGTGSFLEEQAARLGCGIRDYADRTEGVAAPMTSDRCTVFMQRDLNHLMTEGYAVDEVLASALHSVRENYLNKVAVRSRIGAKVFFQGATARIRTLVAAFEQALGKPILVSRFCSHTGALGAALQLMDERKIREAGGDSVGDEIGGDSIGGEADSAADAAMECPAMREIAGAVEGGASRAGRVGATGLVSDGAVAGADSGPGDASRTGGTGTAGPPSEGGAAGANSGPGNASRTGGTETAGPPSEGGAAGAESVPEEASRIHRPAGSRFRGIGLWKTDIPVRTEVCGLCRNACKITVAEVEGDTVAFGFLCGRDYGTERFVARAGEGSEPLDEKRRLLRVIPGTDDTMPEKRGLRALADMLPRPRIGWPGRNGDADGGSGIDGADQTAAKGRKAELDGTDPPDVSAADAAGESGNETRFPVLGLPAALYMTGELPFWEKLFALLGIPVTVDRDTDPIESGKALTGAEFCAPMTALHGRVSRLLEKADFVFVPFYMDEILPSGASKSYCYYSQFAPSLVRQIAPEGRVITPVVKTAWNDARGPREVRDALTDLPLPAGAEPPDAKTFEAAWKAAREWFDARRAELARFHAEKARMDDVNIMLLGRPYVVADAAMNKDVPRLFTDTGVRVFDMDMMDAGAAADDAMPWNYASRIMNAAERIADTDGTYPVLVTSFMCSPDSFVLPYVREIWEKKGKPYLVLELDGHGSSVGYGTRVEAAVRSFRNHFHGRRAREREAAGAGQGFTGGEVSAAGPGPAGRAPTVPGSPGRSARDYETRRAADIREKTLLLPNWDTDVMSLVCANLRREGIDARLLEESDVMVREGSRKSDGQCLPLSVIAREVSAYVRKHALDPARTALWMLKSNWSCNIPLYPRHIHHLLEQEGGGMEKVTIYIDTIAFTETTPLSMISTYYAYMFGGLLKRIACRIRPYENNPGETDRVLAMARDRLTKVFLGRGDRMDAARDIVARFESIPVDRSRPRPKVAIFGDVYVRDNDVMNQDLIRFIERHGGEVITMPYSRYAKMISETHFARLSKERRYRDLAVWRLFLAALKVLEKSYNELFAPLAGPEETYTDDPEGILAPYGVTPEHHGESMENLLKIHYLSTRHDDITLFVQTSPSFCCAGLITEAMRKTIEERTGIPVVSITYDGTGGNKNDVVIPYLTFPRRGSGSRVPEDGPGTAKGNPEGLPADERAEAVPIPASGAARRS